jgi:hypothetical protein
VIDKSTGANAENLIGLFKENKNRTSVFFKIGIPFKTIWRRSNIQDYIITLVIAICSIKENGETKRVMVEPKAYFYSNL